MSIKFLVYTTKNNPSRILGVGGKYGVFGRKSGVRVSKLSDSTELALVYKGVSGTETGV